MKDSVDFEEKELIDALTDSGMDTESIEEFVNYFRLNQTEYEKRMLFSLRAMIVNDLHEDQEKLYRLDYLINLLKLK